MWIVYKDPYKDFRNARRFGQLKYVFSTPLGRTYHTERMLTYAREVLADWRAGDYLLMVGDPALCGVCMAVVAELDGVIPILRWDREEFQYVPQTWDFDLDFETADDNTAT